MKHIILLAGATGNLGHRIVHALLKKEATIRAIVRPSADPEKITDLEQLGVAVFKVDLKDVKALTELCKDVTCVVSALQGLREVIVDTQKAILDAAVKAGVPHFIASDYSTDFNELPTGENRNFDLRKDFKKYLDAAPIRASSVFNGAFADILTYNTPVLDLKKKSIGYWGTDPDWKMDFTTMDDTAAFTAAAALDIDAPGDMPRDLHIAGFQVSPNDLVTLAKEITGENYQLIPMGGLKEFGEQVRQQRAANPEGEKELYPRWQSAQYMHGMFSTHHASLDNDRYPGIDWTDAKKFLTGFFSAQRPRS